MFLRSVKKTQFLLVYNKTSREAEVPLLSAKYFVKVKKKPTNPNFPIQLQDNSIILTEERKFIIVNSDPCLHVILSICL